MQEEQKWVVTGNVLFLEGGYQLSTNGKQALSQYVPRRGFRSSGLALPG
jgi:hypothetical protein